MVWDWPLRQKDLSHVRHVGRRRARQDGHQRRLAKTSDRRVSAALEAEIKARAREELTRLQSKPKRRRNAEERGEIAGIRLLLRKHQPKKRPQYGK